VAGAESRSAVPETQGERGVWRRARRDLSNIHTDEEFARRNIFGGTINAGPGDTVTFEGEVCDKRLEGGAKIVDRRGRGINQRGELVCLSDATMMLPS